jgi:UDPglucose--hexose-1-phosphate uridylyltransferase
MGRQVFVRSVKKKDGRPLSFYGWKEHSEPLREELPPLQPSKAPFRRWHPLRQEWVSYAGVRQGRTFLPDAASCPLCPAREGQGLTEVPALDFELAVFENRFPAFRLDAAEVAFGGDAQPSVGQCEVVVFSPDHNGSLGSQSVERIELLFELWAKQARQMMDDHGLAAVLPFETRGEEIGVTLPHPHGQIYGFDFVPDLLAKSAEAQKAAPVVSQLLGQLPPGLILDQGEQATAFVPDIARYPFEIWVVPKRRVSGPWEFTEDERWEMATFLKRSLLRLDGLFGKAMPYVLSAQLAPKGYEESYHFTVQIWPLRRDTDKMKFLASVEQISGIFLVDVPPELAAERLQSVEVSF